jgi:hypothetical protein
MPKFEKSVAVLLIAVLLTFGLTGCGSKYNDDMPGVWNWSFAGTTLVVTLKKDGTGTLKGPMGEKKMTWRIQKGNNFVFTDGGKDSGFLIDSIENGTLKGKDPSSPGTPIVWKKQK